MAAFRGFCPYRGGVPRLPTDRRAVAASLFAVALGVSAAVAATGDEPGHLRNRPAVLVAAPARPPLIVKAPADRPPRAVPAPDGLPKIDYWTSPRGFPADPAPTSLASVTEGLHPRRKLAVYDAPGGRPRAVLPRSISGLPVTVPIVGRRAGWVAVLLPSVNRRIGWLPTTGWSPRPLPDQLVLDLSAHRLTWSRDGRRRAAWTVAVGSRRTPTPHGRTFVLGRTGTVGSVYAGLDALVLGAVPEDRDALAPSLREGHTGIHAWTQSSALGRSISNGCLRLPPDAQRTLLHHIAPGTTVHVVP